MTVGQLIAALSGAPLEAPVVVQGSEGNAYGMDMVLLTQDIRQDGGGFGLGVLMVPDGMEDRDCIVEAGDVVLWGPV